MRKSFRIREARRSITAMVTNCDLKHSPPCAVVSYFGGVGFGTVSYTLAIWIRGRRGTFNWARY